MRDLREKIDTLWTDLLDKDDRTSPAEYPEMALITYEEFADYVTVFLPPAPDGGTEGSWREPTFAEAMAVATAYENEETVFEGGRAAWRAVGRAMLAASPSVSPVGPKGEEKQGLMASRDLAPTVSAVRVAAHPDGGVSALVERVARAIAAAKRAPELRGAETIDGKWTAYCGQARAAIAAIDSGGWGHE